MHFDIFSQGDSVVHKLDPRFKILAFVPLVFIVALLDEVPAALVYLSLAVLSVIIARIEIRPLFYRLLALNGFLVLLWLTLPFSFQGDTLLRLGDLALTSQGVFYTLIITLKANTILLFTITIIGTTGVFSLAHAMFHLKCPRKLVYLTVFIYRYISVVHEEYERLRKTAKARSFRPGTNVYTFKMYAYMVGMLFVKSYERSQRIYQALVLRGFRGDFPMLRHFRLQKADMIFAVVALLMIIGRFLI
jgi:cobalt/nickel transport system permease protein